MAGRPDWGGSFHPFLPNGIGAIFSAMGLTFIAFQGYEVIAQCSEEVVDPGRNIPRAIFFALLIVIPIYLMVAFVSIGAIRSGTTPSWTAFAMARDHNLPPFLGKVHAVKKTPHAAIAASAVIVILMAVALPIEDVASAEDIMLLLVLPQG